MSKTMALPKEKKLCVIFRVEPGCLGPQGADFIDDFCVFAQKSVETLESNYVRWNIVPRSDKKLLELEYQVLGKKITHFQANKYLSVFEKNLDDFETLLNDRLATLIDEYFAR